MANYSVNDLRDDLAKTIKALREGDKDMTVEKAKAISEIAQTMINSAKVEVEMLKTVGRGRMTPTGFIAIEHQDTLSQQEAAPEKTTGALPSPDRPKPHVRNPVGCAPRGTM